VVTAPVDDEPLVGLAPDHAPEAMHEVAFAADQATVELPPLATVLGFALKATVGAGGATDTVADCTACRPKPSQVNV
jgi:hypothetical protein